MMMTRPGPLNVGLANNPFGISGPAWVDPVSTLGLALTSLMVGAALFLAVVATAVRFRRGGGIEREQIKWFVAANAATVMLLLVVLVDPALDMTWFDAVAHRQSRAAADRGRYRDPALPPLRHRPADRAHRFLGVGHGHARDRVRGS